MQLGRISSAGSFTALASTTVSGGRYSFNFTRLGLTFTSDLVVRVATGAVQMRAFVTEDTVDINPISESAVQVVLDHITLRHQGPVWRISRPKNSAISSVASMH